MFKQILTAGAVMTAAPLLAQQTTTPVTPAPTATPAPSATTAVPARTTPMTPQTGTAAPAPAQPSATPAPAQPAGTAAQTTGTAGAQTGTGTGTTASGATGAQASNIIDAEFPTYDKDSSGTLNNAEFSEWMVKLKTASDPSTQADSAATRSWVAAAFAQADADRSSSLTKAELATFLGINRGS
jgi:hypothetical protein